MEAVALLHPCALCADAGGPVQPSCGRCPRCWRRLCRDHLGAPAPGQPCPACARDPLPARASLTTRMTLVSAVAVAGMLAGAVAMLLLATLLGLGGELTVLFMLVAELAGGALAGRHADRHVDAWLEAPRRISRTMATRSSLQDVMRITSWPRPVSRRASVEEFVS